MAISKIAGDALALQVDTADGTNFVTVGGLSNAVSFDSDSEVIEVWGLGDTIKENLAGAINPGSTTFDVFYTKADSQHQALVAAYHNRSTCNWQVYNVDATAVHRGPFHGFISAWSDEVAKGSVYTASLTVTHTEGTGLLAS